MTERFSLCKFNIFQYNIIKPNKVEVRLLNIKEKINKNKKNSMIIKEDNYIRLTNLEIVRNYLEIFIWPFDTNRIDLKQL